MTQRPWLCLPSPSLRLHVHPLSVFLPDASLMSDGRQQHTAGKPGHLPVTFFPLSELTFIHCSHTQRVPPIFHFWQGCFDLFGISECLNVCCSFIYDYLLIANLFLSRVHLNLCISVRDVTPVFCFCLQWFLMTNDSKLWIKLEPHMCSPRTVMQWFSLFKSAFRTCGICNICFQLSALFYHAVCCQREEDQRDLRLE